MKETQISHHPLHVIVWDLLKKNYFSKSFLEEAASERAKVMSREVGRIKKKKKAWGKKEKRQKRERKALSESINSSKKINKNYISNSSLIFE